LVGKRLGKAVVRNRVRRRLRELMRTIAVQGGWDMLVIARAQSVDVPFADLKSATEKLLVQSGLLSQKQGEKL
jgi:ribonuclease P protein component